MNDRINESQHYISKRQAIVILNLRINFFFLTWNLSLNLVHKSGDTVVIYRPVNIQAKVYANKFK